MPLGSHNLTMDRRLVDKVFSLVVGRVHILLSSKDESASRAYHCHYKSTLVEFRNRTDLPQLRGLVRLQR